VKPIPVTVSTEKHFKMNLTRINSSPTKLKTARRIDAAFYHKPLANKENALNSKRAKKLKTIKAFEPESPMQLKTPEKSAGQKKMLQFYDCKNIIPKTELTSP